MNKVLKKIAKKVFVILPIVPIEWMIEKILKFLRIVHIEKELDMFKRKQKVGLNFRHYLPDTEERIERLRRVINRRPVAIILHGSSATELEARITELEDCDICYFSLNAFRVIEKYILQKINRNLSFVMCAAAPGRQMDDIIDFLERQEDNILFSERISFHPPKRDPLHPQKMPPGFDFDEFIKKYDEKLLFFTGTPATLLIRSGLFLRVPNIEYPLHFSRENSFSMLLLLALIGGASQVVIFGDDGGRTNTRELYFRESDPEYQRFYTDRYTEQSMEQRIMGDTRWFNAVAPLIIERIYKVYNLRPVDIVNCSPQSHYTPLRKLSYDETFALLKSFKRDAG